MLFEIKTQCTFENVYLIEADTEEDAIETVKDDGNPPSFFQKSLGETVVNSNSGNENRTDIVKKLRAAGYC